MAKFSLPLNFLRDRDLRFSSFLLEFSIMTILSRIVFQAAMQSGKYLNALHGAFNRDLKSNFHAYDILFVKMVNKILDMSYYLLSKSFIIRLFFKFLLKLTKIQSKTQLKFRN
jgi:hypothetical protein